MTCSWASRLISPVVDGSDDKTTTFTVLLFNFHLFPLDLPLHNWFLCAFICLPFTSIHLSPLFPWCFFCLFSPLCHELTSLFLILLGFFTHLSIFLPYLFPFSSPVASCHSPHPVKPMLSHSSLSYFTLQPHLSGSSSLSLLLSASYPHFFLFGILHALLLILVSPLCYSFHLSPHLSDGALAFNIHIFQGGNPWMLQLSHRAELPSSAFQAFCLPALCAGALSSTGGKLKKKRTDLFQSAKRDK